MNVEKNLMVLASAVESVEKLAQRMQESIEEYKEAILLSNEESIKRAHERMLCNCHMLILNYEAKGTLQGAMQLLKQMEEFDSRNKLFTVEERINLDEESLEIVSKGYSFKIRGD